MFEALDKIFEYLYSGFDILYNIVLSILRFIQAIPDILTFSTSLHQFIPTWALGFIVATISMSVVMIIANRKS